MSPTSHRSRRRRSALQLEELENRLLLSAGVQPTAVEQLFLEELNDARANPAAYGASIGLDLSSVAPSPPLAFNPQIIEAARGHSQDMNDRGYFDHITPEGLDPGDRLTNVGFSWNSFGESIAGGSAYATPAEALAGLIIDSGVPDLGHRRQLLDMDPVFQNQFQVGIGVVQNGSGPLTNYYTIDTAGTADSRPFITGVVYTDSNGNGKYDVGEGLGGVTISVAGVGTTTTFASGGYSFQANPGTYTVTASGGGLAAPITQTVTLGTTNVRLNFAPAAGGNSGSSGFSDGQVDAFVRKLYVADLGRQASDAEVALWHPAVLAPNGTMVVANAIARSPEARDLLVRGWYQAYLGRPASNGEEQFWVNLLVGGATEEQTMTGILSSQEFYQRAAGQNPGLTPDQAYIQALFQTFLGRTAGPSEVNNFVTNVLAGPGRSAAALIVLQSQEYRTDLVEWDYANLLHRSSPPSSAEVSSWVFAPLDLTGIRVGFMGSYEYVLNG